MAIPICSSSSRMSPLFQGAKEPVGVLSERPMGGCSVGSEVFPVFPPSGTAILPMIGLSLA